MDDELVPSRACERLRETAERHRARLGEDGLYVFLKIHECICRRVEHSAVAPLVELNAGFVDECLATYRILEESRWNDLHRDWMWAYRAYMRDRFALGTCLPFLAAAHITVDLETVLSRLEVEKKDYDAVFQHISQCMNQVGRAYGLLNPIAQVFTAFEERREPVKAWSLAFRILMALGWLPVIRNYAIQKMREYAWATAQARKNAPPFYENVQD